MVPIAIAMTCWYCQEPLFNEMRWTCVPTAQVALATLYLAFGPSTLLPRFSLTFLAVIGILISVAWAQNVLSVYEIFWFSFPSHLAHTLIPALLSGLCLSALRPLIGTVRWHNARAHTRLAISELFVATFCFGVLFSLYQSILPESAVTFKVVATDLPFSSLSALCGVSCLLLFMGHNSIQRIIGSIGISIGLTTWCSFAPSSMRLEMAAPWLIVSVSLIMLRIFGIRLVEARVVADFATEELPSPFGDG